MADEIVRSQPVGWALPTKLYCEWFYKMVGDALATSFLSIGLID